MGTELVGEVLYYHVPSELGLGSTEADLLGPLLTKFLVLRNSEFGLWWSCTLQCWFLISLLSEGILW